MTFKVTQDQRNCRNSMSYISFLLVICGYNRLYQVNLAPFPTGKWCKVTHLYFRDITTFTVYVTALKSLSCSIRNLKLQATCALRFTVSTS